MSAEAVNTLSIEKQIKSRREMSYKTSVLAQLLPLVRVSKTWLLIILIINLPSIAVVNAVSFYYGANEEMLENLKNISNNSKEQSNTEDLKSIYTFCNILPILVESGRVPANEQTERICNKLVDVLEPMLGDKRLPVKRRRLFDLARKNSNAEKSLLN